MTEIPQPGLFRPPMVSFFGDPVLKDLFLQWMSDPDTPVLPPYVDDEHEGERMWEAYTGVPRTICEMFVGLALSDICDPDDPDQTGCHEAKAFGTRFFGAIPVGVNLLPAQWKFCHWLLTEVLAHPLCENHNVKNALRFVRDIISSLASAPPDSPFEGTATLEEIEAWERELMALLRPQNVDDPRSCESGDFSFIFLWLPLCLRLVREMYLRSLGWSTYQDCDCNSVFMMRHLPQVHAGSLQNSDVDFSVKRSAVKCLFAMAGEKLIELFQDAGTEIPDRSGSAPAHLNEQEIKTALLNHLPLKAEEASAHCSADSSWNTFLSVSREFGHLPLEAYTWRSFGEGGMGWRAQHYYGVPPWLSRYLTDIDEQTSAETAVRLQADLLDLIEPGMDLAQVQWRFLHYLLSEPVFRTLHYVDWNRIVALDLCAEVVAEAVSNRRINLAAARIAHEAVVRIQQDLQGGVVEAEFSGTLDRHQAAIHGAAVAMYHICSCPEPLFVADVARIIACTFGEPNGQHAAYTCFNEKLMELVVDAAV